MSMQIQSHQYATPPESFIDPPLTRPPTDEKGTNLVSRIVEEIKNRWEGRDLTTTPWVIYSLDLKGYQELQNELKTNASLCGFAQHKFRYDYIPSISRLVIRMPSTLHEVFITRVVEEIQSQLRSIQGRSADFSKEIRSEGSASIQFTDKDYGKHDPDAQFRHSRAQFPGIVIEVSYSQKRKVLERLADDYILGSDSDIRVVVGLDIEYKSGKKATLSVWRPNIITNKVGERELVAQLVVANQVFRDNDGNPSPSSTGLQLCLRDFATEALAGADLHYLIFLSPYKLCSLLEDAEHSASVIRQQAGIITINKPWIRKRRRNSSPLEELTLRDEKRFRADERRAANQATRDDSSYKTDSISEGEGS